MTAIAVACVMHMPLGGACACRCTSLYASDNTALQSEAQQTLGSVSAHAGVAVSLQGRATRYAVLCKQVSWLPGGGRANFDNPAHSTAGICSHRGVHPPCCFANRSYRLSEPSHTLHLPIIEL
jgi:hypothetical protein